MSFDILAVAAKAASGVLFACSYQIKHERVLSAYPAEGQLYRCESHLGLLYRTQIIAAEMDLHRNMSGTAYHCQRPNALLALKSCETTSRNLSVVVRVKPCMQLHKQSEPCTLVVQCVGNWLLGLPVHA